jgi:hypothetical protein
MSFTLNIYIHSTSHSGHTSNPDALQYFTLIRKFSPTEKGQFPPEFARRFGKGRRQEQHIRVCESEREMLNLLMATIQR